MTLEQAKNLVKGQWIYSVKFRTANNTPQRAKVLSVKTWKRQPDKVLISLRYGIKRFFKMNENELDEIEPDEATADKRYQESKANG